MWFVIVLALVICIGVAIALSNKRREAKSPRPDPYVVEAQKSSAANSNVNGITASEQIRPDVIRRGTVRSSVYADTQDAVDLLFRRFFAFDVETTGLSPRNDRIIQIGAVLFEDQKVTQRFTTFINPHIHIPEIASSVNHITDEMVADAPSESEVVPALCAFLEDALNGSTPLVAHNATFDLNFLSEMLERNGVDATVSYADTLSLSRRHLDNLPNYKQPTVAAALDIDTGTAHRADSDAETCGRILVSLLPAMQHNAEVMAKRFARKQPTQEEKGICAYLVQMLQASGRDTSKLRFEKTGDAINVKHPYCFASFKLPKTKPLYFTIECQYYSPCALEAIPLSGEKNSPSAYKIVISSLDDIQALSSMLFAGFDDMAERLHYFYRHTNWVSQDANDSFQIRDDEVESLIDGYRAFEAALIRAKEEKDQAKINAAEEKRQQQELKRLAREQAAAEKAQQKAEAKAVAPAASLGKPICQYDDDMVLLCEYESVAAAASAVGVSPKSIRDAANGRQRHAAGYVWRY